MPPTTMESNIPTTALQGQSEVAHLMGQIDAECAAAWSALYGPSSGMARHNFIKARYDRLGQLGDELGQLVGEETAIDAITSSLDRLAPQ